MGVCVRVQDTYPRFLRLRMRAVSSTLHFDRKQDMLALIDAIFVLSIGNAMKRQPVTFTVVAALGSSCYEQTEHAHHTRLVLSNRSNLSHLSHLPHLSHLSR